MLNLNFKSENLSSDIDIDAEKRQNCKIQKSREN